MIIIVTGGMGFIGSNFVNHLLMRSEVERIVNIDSLTTGSNIENVKTTDPRYKLIHGDIRDKNTGRFFEDADVVVNFAAETHVDRSIRDPEPFIQSNILGTFNLLEIERRLGGKIRHIQVSTDETYGNAGDATYTEEDPLRPTNPYSASKASADLLCQAYNKTYGLDTIVTRCTNNFGPNQFPEKLIPKTIIRALNDRNIPIYGTGTNVRDWIYVLDHCEAIRFLIESGAPGETYNISSGDEKRNLEIVESILDLLGKPHSLITFVEDRPGHDYRYSLDSGRLRAMGWKPRYKFRDSLRETVEWYTENEGWWRPLATPEVLGETPWKK